ncbi:DNA replication licensing factor mcm10 [Pyricularia oryzae 70-15]|uniref:DNA replication licensing factor mcm10 n=2 Tax=Pyricularia oryzae TaxID=318829 RepID=G4MRZ7_PYRO7|nr:DNA replication licensing factor mcm10 [Pyricularia oryzae 70-15]EHA56666.1 DNA replication licensing factor mcm10 [Pyricularia oryzae 70-15]KAI7930169.1 DNA replication licensing factor mcm10 [Pyricularia oryzae]KAI7930332.1 DNA replication licensing factor mcm10 [Pyricularia oryzae]
MPPSQPSDEPQWPPRSPHEVLLSTPGGREKLRRLAERTSPSPSPARGRMSRTGSSGLPLRSTNSDVMAGMILDGDDDEDEDEEILQLKLQEIQAKLKLKKLQSARAANGAPSSRPDSGADSNARRPQARTAAAAAAARAAKVEDARPRSVEVPASPVKKAIAPPKSPMKVQLGIDKGLRAKDVSLRRSSSTLQQRMQDASERSRSLNDGAEAPVRPLSFSERLALKRNEEAAQVEKQKRIQQIRSSAFAVDREEIERYKAVAQDLPDLADEPQVYSRAEIVGSGKLQKDGGYLRRSSTAPSIRGGQAGSGTGSDSGQAKDATTTTAKSRGKDEASFESYSGFHLKKRILPHEIVTRSITGKQVYKLKDLLRKVKAPTWELPDDECDVVAFAILAAKSEPRSHKARTDSEGNTVNQGNRGMYMVMTLVDLQYEVELFLFNSGFDRFWKLTPGTVLAILNPVIMKPPKGREATGKFSLIINSDEDTILEIGTARDLGFCQATKKDGKACPSWINSKRTEFCEFHSNEAISKARAGRMELNGAGFGGGGGNGKKSKKEWEPFSDPWKYKNSRPVSIDHRTEEQKLADAKRGSYDRDTQSRVFVSRSASSASVIEREGEYLESLQRKEALKRKLLQDEHEKTVAKKLGNLGAGAGREYMQRRAGHKTNDQPHALASNFSLEQQQPSTSAAALDLLNRAKNPPKIDLGPVKRKRPDSATSNSTAGGSSSLGWGSGLRDRLSRMKGQATLSFDQPQKTDNAAAANANSSSGSIASSKADRSPVRKKTRFVTEKGIREAGRESLGTELLPSAAAAAADDALEPRRGKPRRVVVQDDDDDDDLVIV